MMDVTDAVMIARAAFVSGPLYDWALQHCHHHQMASAAFPGT